DATVVIDRNGDVHIEAQGYAVRVEASAAPAPAPIPAAPAAVEARPEPARLERRYFLASEPSHPDGAGFDVAVFVNATWVREIRAGEPQEVFEVTKYLLPGPNKIVFDAKRAGGERAPRDAMLKLFVGEGTVAGDQVTMGVPLVELTRTAGEAGDRTEEFVLVAH
ncbi:MAG TPA: hypothetical protein VD838_05170, partial [Anaeromyxobacteraceae bacterium]|nr:hypothetical protein [Anaeromyxobacteraceae bacterium]